MEGKGVVPFIHNIVNIHGLYYMCFSLVFACLSVHLGAVSQEPCPSIPHPHLPAPPWERGPNGYGPPGLVGASRQGLGLSLHSGSTVLCVCMLVCARVNVCTRGTCVQVCTRGEGHCHRGWGQVRLLEAGPAWVASSQVDPPKVSRRCDGVALRAELLGTQGPQPAFLTVHMPTLD